MTINGFGSIPKHYRRANRIGYLESVLTTEAHTPECQYELHDKCIYSKKLSSEWGKLR